MRRLLATGAVALSLVIPSAAAAASDPVIAAAGDIACGSTSSGSNSCQQKATSDLLVGRGLDSHRERRPPIEIQLVGVFVTRRLGAAPGRTPV